MTTSLIIEDSPYSSVFQGIMPSVASLNVLSDNFDDLMSRPRVAIVGSRKVSPYGKLVTTQFARELAEQGIVIVSGLALGVDAIAHKAALEAGGLTIAVLPGGLDRVYPATHKSLADRIVRRGGALITEYPAGTSIMKHNFIGRNRIVSGMSDALLITEAASNSGTMHTARFALEQGKDVLAVPGNITSPTSAGTNNLIRAGATPATCLEDILNVLGLGLVTRGVQSSDNPEEQLILDLLHLNIRDGDELLQRAGMPVTEFSHILTMMEITGKVKSLGMNQWSPR